jgi:spermidine synthase
MQVEVNQGRTDVAAGSVLMPVFALALFTSAALLFWVQPLIAKILLPFLGGAASVWNTCMVFFQALLLAGYAYVMIISKRLSVRNQALLHVILLLVAVVVLPFSLSNTRLASLPTEGSPVGWLLVTLFLTVGPPFFVISATAPLLQRWFSFSKHKSANDPYFLYAVSNAGSMLALLAFPFLLEPALPIRTQTKVWAAGYVLLVASIICCVIVLRGGSERRNISSDVESAKEEITKSQRPQWVVLAFVPSSLMLGVTTFIATDVASVPLVWIIPLAIYLLTFILAFSNRQFVRLSLASHLLPLGIIGIGSSMIFKPDISPWLTILLHLTVFLLAAFICHRRLALSRPGVANLPEYYLWIAVGGVLGGIFNALVAPLVFSTPVEYPLVIVLACLMRPANTSESQGRKLLWMAFPAFVLFLTFDLAVLVSRLSLPERVQSGIALFLPLLVCYVVTIRRPALFALALAAFLVGARPYLNASMNTLVTERNFFGVWRVTSSQNEDFRRLWHGSTIHGIQFNNAQQKCVATSYYSNDGPLGQIFQVFNNSATVKEVAATGLGSGTVATYAAPGQQWDFYEIDPAIVRIVSDSRYFSFLSECSKAPYRMVIGDARLRMREARNGQYGLIIMDAFSSDSVPAHLITTEALDLYLSKLANDGLLAFHISNRYLSLEPLLSGLARRANLTGRIRADQERKIVGRFPSIWVVLARNDAALGDIEGNSNWRSLNGNVVWTDDSSNILGLLK